jgi:hypothetical protein
MTTQDSQVENSTAPAEIGDSTEQTQITIDGGDAITAPSASGGGVPMEVDTSIAPLT